MASKSRGDIESAVGQLLDAANNDANNVPVLMALAHGFLLLKQTAKARNQLKVRQLSARGVDDMWAEAHDAGPTCKSVTAVLTRWHA